MTSEFFSNVSGVPDDAVFVEVQATAGEPVVSTVIRALDESAVTLPERWALNDAVDVDALGRLFETRLNGEPRGTGVVTFPVADALVAVDDQQTVRVYPRAGEES